MLDLHVHTRASDGAYRPSEVVWLALEAGLEGLAVTDHDTTAGLAEAEEAARRDGIILVPGIELSTLWEDKEVHILGYFIDPGHPRLQDKLADRRQGRYRRAKRILEKLEQLGLPVEWARVQELAGEASLGRPHIAQAMIERGYVGSITEAFDRYLGEGRPAYVPRSQFTPLEAIDLIRAAHGVPVLAHPGLLVADDLIPVLAAGGLRGLEVYYPEHTIEDTAKYRNLADALGLVATGGSDFHGQDGESRADLGTCGVGREVVAALQLLQPPDIT